MRRVTMLAALAATLLAAPGFAQQPDLGQPLAFHALGRRGGREHPRPVALRPGDGGDALGRSHARRRMGMENHAGHAALGRLARQHLRRAAGAQIAKEPQDAFWGGYHAYFADPDGYYWEVAHNPGWELDENGMVVDFGKIKEVVMALDHAFINDVVKINPTAENIAKWIHDLGASHSFLMDTLYASLVMKF